MLAVGGDLDHGPAGGELDHDRVLAEPLDLILTSWPHGL
jgi:hypothetical protein